MNLFVGIDPGKNGAIVVLNEDGSIQDAMVMPDIAILKALGHWSTATKNEVMVVIEDVQPNPSWSNQSIWTFAKHVGQLHLLFPKHRLVAPRTWQASLWLPGLKVAAKSRSLLAAQQRCPTASWKATPRCKKPHDGLVDAFLIAEYGRTHAKFIR